MTRTLAIAPGHVAAIQDAAERAAPGECCGLIEGTFTEGGWDVCAVHESRNLAGEPRRAFLIDPEMHFRLLRALRGSDRAVIGCYHSHPGGNPRPSETDRASAMDDGFVWLIAADVIAAYVFDAAGRRFDPVAIRTG